jgi:hypothetical protein
VIHLKTPFAPLTAALADRAGMVMSPTQLKKMGDKFSSDPVCVGPFKFADRFPQNSITLVKNPNYYDADKVHLDKIVYRIITESSAVVGSSAGRRGRHPRADLHRTPAPVHPGPAVGRPGAGPRHAAPSATRHPVRRAPQPARPAVGVPLPHPLPVGGGSVPDRGAGAT